MILQCLTFVIRLCSQKSPAMQIYIKWHSGDEEMLAQHRRMSFWRTRECSHLTIKKIFVIIVSPRKVLPEIA